MATHFIKHLLPIFTRVQKKNGISNQLSGEPGGHQAPRVACHGTESDQKVDEDEQKSQSNSFPQPPSEAASIQDHTQWGTSTLVDNESFCGTSVTKSTDMQDDDWGSSTLVGCEMTHPPTDIPQANEIDSEAGICSKKGISEQEVLYVQTSRSNEDRLSFEANASYKYDLYRDGYRYTPEQVYQMQSDLDDYILANLQALPNMEHPTTPVVIPGPDGAGWNGKGKGFAEYAADEGQFGYKGGYTQPPNLNGGRNPSGGGGNPNDQNNQYYGNGGGEGDERRGRDGGGPSKGEIQVDRQPPSDYTTPNNNYASTRYAYQKTPAPSGPSESTYLWCCLSSLSVTYRALC